MSFMGRFLLKLITHKHKACASDEQCRLRILPKILSQMKKARIEPKPSACRAEIVPTAPQNREKICVRRKIVGFNIALLLQRKENCR